MNPKRRTTGKPLGQCEFVPFKTLHTSAIGFGKVVTWHTIDPFWVHANKDRSSFMVSFSLN